MKKRVLVIGAGYSGLSAACYLAKSGFEVCVCEKHQGPGGRSRVFEAEGFKFDMGPSWYWMPEVYDKFFEDLGHRRGDFYELKRLNPAFRMYFGKREVLDIPPCPEGIESLFEDIEPGAGSKLRKFMREAQLKYEISMAEFIDKPYLSWLELVNMRVLKAGLSMNLLGSFGNMVRKSFKNPKLVALMDFPILFLGASSIGTPALYSLMNYAGLYLGTWYPMNGMHELVKAFEDVAKSLGVRFEYNQSIEQILAADGQVYSVKTKDSIISVDYVVASGDYVYMESLLEEEFRNYDKTYWESREMSPSALIFYLGFDRKLDSMKHHQLFFDESFENHSRLIYDDPQWPVKPLFYTCCPSRTDVTVAPDSCENVFILVPLASGLSDSEEQRERCFDGVMSRLEYLTGENGLRDSIIYKKSYAMNDFSKDYHAYKGNAYGLANTLKQTAFLKPKMVNKKLHNLFYTGQLTVPGPGVPPAILSGKIASRMISQKEGVPFTF